MEKGFQYGIPFLLEKEFNSRQHHDLLIQKKKNRFPDLLLRFGLSKL